MPPDNDGVLEQAGHTVALLKALSHQPDFRKDLRAIPSSAQGLMHVCDFVGRTFREYWVPLLPPQKYAELSADLESFHGIEKNKQLQDMQAKFEEMKNRDATFDKDAWPEFTESRYKDCLSRNQMAAMLIQDRNQQSMMGGPYNYSQEVIDVCKDIPKA